MPETCVDLAAAIGAICAFVIAAAVRISSRRGLTLLLIEIVLWWAPDVRQDATKVVASERARRSHERNEPMRLQHRADRP